MMVIQLMSNLIESKEWAGAEKSLSGSCHKPKLESAARRHQTHTAATLRFDCLPQLAKFKASLPRASPVSAGFGHDQSFEWDAQRSGRSGAVLKHLHLQGRVISHDSVELNKTDSFGVGNVKNRLYRFTSSIGKAAVKSDMKNIVKGKVKILKFRKVGKPIERLTRPPFVTQQIYKNFVYRGFV
jgi:hypothetical protein